MTTPNASALRRCGHCRRRYRATAPDSARWNVTLSSGVVVGITCPGCQTTEENLEAEINLTTMNYGTDGLGRVIGRPKIAI
jgi:hypothetical protein